MYFFAGVDPAPSEGQKSDDGAVVALRAEPKHIPADGVLSNQPADWHRDVVYSKRIRKASSRQWAGILHQLQDRFKFARICLDPGGGGQWINRDLADGRQSIGGVEEERSPIVTADNSTVVMGQFVLMMFKRGDPGIEALWPELAGDDLLVDAMFSAGREALEHAEIGLCSPIGEWPREKLAGWGEERVWALRNLTALLHQLRNILVATNEDGTWAFTRRNARQFSAKGKKDFASAFLMANVAFMSWVRTQEQVWQQGAGATMFGGW